MRGLPFPLSRGIYFVSVVGLEPTMFSSRVLVPKTNAFQPNFATLTFRVSGGIWTPIYQVAAGYLSHSDTLTFIRAFDRIWTYNPFITSEVHYQLCYKGILVVDAGYDPTTSDVSDRRSTNWATWTCCGQGRVRSYNLSVNSRLLYQLSYLSICCGRGGTRTPSLKWERFYRPRGYQLPVTLPYCTPYRNRTYDLLYVKQPLLPAELRVCKDNTFFLITKFFCVPGWIRTNGLPVKSGRLEPDSATRTFVCHTCHFP